MLRIVSVWTGKAGSPWYSTLYFDGAISTEAQAAVNKVKALMVKLLADQANGLSVNIEPFVASVRPADGEVIGGFVTDVGVTGVSSGGPTMWPAAAQLLAQFRTGIYQGGREIKGKMFVPAYPAAASDPDGRLNSVVAADVEGFFQTWNASGPDLLVWSRKNGTVSPVSAITVSREIAILSSRRD